MNVQTWSFASTLCLCYWCQATEVSVTGETEFGRILHRRGRKLAMLRVGGSWVESDEGFSGSGWVGSKNGSGWIIKN